MFDSVIVTGNYEPESTYDFSHVDVVEIEENSFKSFIQLRDRFDWDEYDVAVFSGNRPQFTLWRDIPIPTLRYCHSPVRTFWSLRDRDFRQSSGKSRVGRSLVAPTYRILDRKLAAKHDLIFTNSHNIRSQVNRFYGLDAEVLYPPIDFDEYYYSDDKDFWLSVNRLVPKKRVFEQIQAFEQLDEQLLIVGGIDDKFQQYGEKVVETASEMDNVEIKGFVPDDALKELYSRCEGVIYLPYFEDFGIVPVEALASGKPVIAAAEGGPIETVVDGETGWLINPVPKQIRKAIKSSTRTDEMRERCMQSARKFDVDQFGNKYRRELRELVG